MTDVFVIAEAGSNWRMGTPERDLLMARRLVDAAVDAGADAVKFQTYRAASVYVHEAGESDYLAALGIAKPIAEIFEDLEMPYELIPPIADYCSERGIEFMSTPFSVEDARAVDPFVQRHKVASYEINHVRLIEHLAGTGKPLIMSTGAATVHDIAFGLEIARELAPATSRSSNARPAIRHRPRTSRSGRSRSCANGSRCRWACPTTAATRSRRPSRRSRSVRSWSRSTTPSTADYRVPTTPSPSSLMDSPRWCVRSGTRR